MTTRGFGLAGETSLAAILTAARAAERHGYDSFWLSQPREGSTLGKLERVAAETERIRLGVGAIPLTGQNPDEIFRTMDTLSLPPERLRLGIGSGTGPGSLDRLRRGVEQLRALVNVEIVVAPLGPKMCALAGELADTVLLNWLTPEYARRSVEWIENGAAAAGRPRPRTAAYVRCAIGDEVGARLAAECDRYGAFPHYAAHFARQGVQPSRTVIHARNADELRERLGRYDPMLDHVVARAITPTDAPAEILTLVEAVSPDQ